MEKTSRLGDFHIYTEVDIHQGIHIVEFTYSVYNVIYIR